MCFKERGIGVQERHAMTENVKNISEKNASDLPLLACPSQGFSCRKHQHANRSALTNHKTFDFQHNIAPRMPENRSTILKITQVAIHLYIPG